MIFWIKYYFNKIFTRLLIWIFYGFNKYWMYSKKPTPKILQHQFDLMDEYADEYERRT